MKKTYLLVLLSLFLFSSCSSDDDNDDKPGGNSGVTINPSSVFTGGRPKMVDDMHLFYDSKGLVTEIKTEDQHISFTYGDNVKTKESQQYPSDVVMKYIYREGSTIMESYTIYMKVGSNGFVENCIQIYDILNPHSNQDKDTWAFKYNADGQIIEMKRSEGDNETTTITYKDGNIVKVVMRSESKEEDNNKFTGTIAYTSDKHKDGVINKGCIMMFDDTFGIDLDEMRYAYYAGILGKATKLLPLQLVDIDYKETSNFEWSIDEKGYPTKLVGGGSYTDSYFFEW